MSFMSFLEALFHVHDWVYSDPREYEIYIFGKKRGTGCTYSFRSCECGEQERTWNGKDWLKVKERNPSMGGGE